MRKLYLKIVNNFSIPTSMFIDSYGGLVVKLFPYKFIVDRLDF